MQRGMLLGMSACVALEVVDFSCTCEIATNALCGSTNMTRVCCCAAGHVGLAATNLSQARADLATALPALPALTDLNLSSASPLLGVVTTITDACMS